jgi:hypothetical protein
LKKRGKVLNLFLIWGLAIEGKSMPLIKFFCCLDVYLKLYLRLKLSRVNGLFYIIYMFYLYLVVLFVWI